MNIEKEYHKEVNPCLVNPQYSLSISANSTAPNNIHFAPFIPFTPRTPLRR